MSPLVSVHQVRMAFGGVEVVKGVSLSLFPGEVHAIVGENGAGKSTVAKIIAGVHAPVAGHVALAGQAVTLANPRDAIQRGIALIHQEPLTFLDLNVAENVFVGHQPRRGPWIDGKEMRRRTQEILDSLGVRLRPTDRVGNLSVADQQMVELAAALSHGAKVLLMDETTAALTPKEVAELFTIVRRLREQGCAIAFVTHHLDEVFALADRITVLRDGEHIADRTPTNTDVAEIVRLMVGRDLAEPVDHSSSSAGAPILEVQDLAAEPAFRGVSFTLRQGEILGLGGLVGAGRTEVCQTLFGVRRATSGRVRIGGQPVRLRTARDAMRAGLAMVPEDRQHEGLLTPLPIEVNVSLPSLPRMFRQGWLRRAEERSVAERALAPLKTVFRSVAQPVKQLSGGNQQKVVLAKWLLTEPKILILDEPTRGVDVGAKAEIHRLIRQLVADGLSILVVSSDLPELLSLSDRVLVMREGNLVAELSAAEATPDRVMIAATGQEAHVA